HIAAWRRPLDPRGKAAKFAARVLPGLASELFGIQVVEVEPGGWETGRGEEPAEDGIPEVVVLHDPAPGAEQLWATVPVEDDASDDVGTAMDIDEDAGDGA